MIPSIDARYSLNLGGIVSLKSGIPASVLTAIGKRIAEGMGIRIRSLSMTANGELLDPNAPAWADRKLLKTNLSIPLVFYGGMTDKSAWEVVVDQQSGTIDLVLNGAHHEKWDTIMQIAEDKGKNWNEAWGLGAWDYEQLIRFLRSWASSIGVK